MRVSLPCSPHCCSQVCTGLTLTHPRLSDTCTYNRKGPAGQPLPGPHWANRPRGPDDKGSPLLPLGRVCAEEAQSAGSSEASRTREPGPSPSHPSWLAWKHTLGLISSFPVLFRPFPSSGSLGSLPKVKALVSQILLLMEGEEG